MKNLLLKLENDWELDLGAKDSGGLVCINVDRNIADHSIDLAINERQSDEIIAHLKAAFKKD